MKKLSLILTVLCLSVLAGCKKKKDPDPVPVEKVTFAPLLGQIDYTVVTQKIVGETSNTTLAYGGVMSRDATNTWITYAGSLTSVSKAGRGIYKDQQNAVYIMYADGSIGKFSNQSDNYFLDSEDNLYRVTLVGGNPQWSLDVGKKGSFNWSGTVCPNNIGSYILGVMPTEGIVFLNPDLKLVHIYTPSTDVWKEVSYLSDLNPPGDQYSVENDGKIYFPVVTSGICDILDPVTGSEVQISLPTLPDGASIPNIEVAANGEVYLEAVGLPETTKAFRKTSTGWVDFVPETNYEFRGNLKIYGNTMYYYAYCHQDGISRGVAIKDLSTGQTTISGGNLGQDNPEAGFKTSQGHIYSTNYFDKQLYRHDGDLRTPLGIYNISGFYEDRNGNLFMLGPDTLYKSGLNLSNMQKTEGIVANLGGGLTKGAPQGMVMRQLSNNTYYLWLVTAYYENFDTYYLNYFFTSTDGVNWTSETINYGSWGGGTCVGIDPSGKIIFKEIQYDPFYGTDKAVYWQSTNKTATWNSYTDSYPPTLITNAGTYIHVDLNEIRTSTNGWEPMPTATSNVTPVGGGVVLTGDNRIMRIEDRLWISDKTF